MKRAAVGLVLTLTLLGGIAAATIPPEGAVEAASGLSGEVVVEGGKIFYDVTGDGPPLIMIHDGLLHRETWDAQFTEFAKSHRVIRWDRRGYGESDPPQAPFSNRDDLLAVMAALDVERATLVGCSSGALLALEFALDHPEKVSSLVLVGPIVSGYEFSEHFRTRGGRGIPPRGAAIAERIEYWSARDPWILDPEDRAARARMRSLLTENPQNLGGSGRYARPPSQPVRRRLSEIAVPTLLIVGESDIPDVHSHVGVIQSQIPGAERVVLVGAGHLCHMEVPEVFNETVLGFLGSSLEESDD